MSSRGRVERWPRSDAGDLGLKVFLGSRRGFWSRVWSLILRCG